MHLLCCVYRKTLPPPPQVDYLIGCHFDEASQQLLLVAGSIEGPVGFFPIAEQQHRAGQLPPGSNLLQPPAVVLQGCHRCVVLVLVWAGWLLLSAGLASGGGVAGHVVQSLMS